MRLLLKHVHEQLERRRARHREQHSDQPEFPASASDEEQEIEALVTLARSFPSTAPLQVDAQFADRLEERLLASASRQTLLSQSPKRARRGRRYVARPMKLTVTPMQVVFPVLCLLVLSVGAGVLVLRSLPLSPGTAHATIHQVERTDQAAHQQLKVLTSLADAVHPQAYRTALATLEQQIDDCAREAAAVPAGPEWSQAEQELTELKADTRQVLSRLLQSLALPERILTTTELGELGAPVPRLQSALFTLNATQNQATVVLVGSGILPGARLLIDNTVLPVNGTMQQGAYEVIISWSAQRPRPQLLGIVNVDNTATQTAVLTIQIEPTVDDRGRDNGGHGGGRDGGHGG